MPRRTLPVASEATARMTTTTTARRPLPVHAPTCRGGRTVPDFRVADTAPEHPKLRAVGLPAIGLWAAAGAYAMRELTDGWVPEYWVLTWPGAKRHAAALVGIGLWERETRTGIPGYRFRDWFDYQRPASKIHEEREKGKERARRSRERSGERAASRDTDVRSESHDSRALTRALTPQGSSRGGSSSTERGQDRNAPRPRCPEHAQLPPDERAPACGACKRLRIEAEQQVVDQAERAAAERAERRSCIDSCPDCDDNGMRDFGALGVGRCTHSGVTAAAS